MSTWRKIVPFDEENAMESEVPMPDGQSRFIVDRSTMERLLLEAGYTEHSS